VLEQMPALLALGAPSPASYLRLVPSHWAGAYACWGLENREASVRLVAGLPRVANAEFKSFDLSANPYLVLGGVIAAGLAGGGTLPEEVEGDPAHLADPPPRLPSSLDQAVEAFSASTLLAEAMGEPLYEAVRAVRRAESEQWAGAAPEALIAATRWRY
jgi:glutamine synthetase